ncbi:MAG: aspartate carbamoyltransferase regulatory subunit [Candidatus Kerfeldbacteria bacterium RIFCSPLOWO2_01_FULL_48_11]|uniref:Aspartate carbamoyltransferase regulatory chain n=1 Tax=Candidatus Kerfeldbacteria bacterium RIFCSPLOWO2_01_FULL_48_11 TaxID=1798543 RepID=A0A1G2B667_9BACT|nr:MAG: Aspartate carbamoyltransferase regulatory chain [Parcubacteria group bacterium GW2011_GWA2_48_9]KKW16472.1 MAG: Aspartate carbamoyltransferase regulatory chain [Parcubacteria group bacterium GW2011_GWC2_49_9]OGY84698.1 MAG: aspartate carbamoyltransferase regulatory subunit [Candidatus Kerfeldbacteria bacterium RIFCSPLOWO2_01_FULL_48_11]HCJ52390.1 aspartate carbamoyltransferase regulatory subunit [Candidatus Kerfeldbacteria bacterium]HCM67704.1 aspartate carbamoyltransferase regulatory s
MRAFRVYAIKQGTVIDHIPEGKGVEIIELLSLRKWKKVVTLGMGFTSRKLGAKDIVKIEEKELNQDEANKIALIAPTATINIIRNFKLVRKTQVKVPRVIEGIVKCANPACITNHDHVRTRFYLEKAKPLLVLCHYCERYFDESALTLL